MIMKEGRTTWQRCLLLLLLYHPSAFQFFWGRTWGKHTWGQRGCITRHQRGRYKKGHQNGTGDTKGIDRICPSWLSGSGDSCGSSGGCVERGRGSGVAWALHYLLVSKYCTSCKIRTPRFKSKWLKLRKFQNILIPLQAHKTEIYDIKKIRWWEVVSMGWYPITALSAKLNYHCQTENL